MAHFAFTRAGGVWAALSGAASAELADIDAKTYKAINGDEGGTWAPSSLITIGGSGLAVTGPATFSGATSVGGVVGFQCSPLAEFFGRVECSDGLYAIGAVKINEGNPANLARFYGLAQFDVAVQFDGVVNFGAGAVFSAALFTAVGGLSVTGGNLISTVGAQLEGNNVFGLTSAQSSYFNSTVTLAAPVTLSGAGHINKRYIVGADADTTYNVSTVDVIRVPSGVLSANRVYTIGTAGVAAGSMIRIYTEDQVNSIAVRRVDTTQIGAQLKKNAATSYNDWMDIIYTGSTWENVGFGNYTA